MNVVILAGIVLRNMLCEKPRPSYMPCEYIDQENPNAGILTEGQWHNNVPATFLEPPLVGCRWMSWNTSRRRNKK